MKIKTGILLGFALSGTCLTHAQRAIEIETVLVGDAGNPDDTTGFGGVSYEYRIGTYEVTNEQYTAFLNAVASTDTHGLYNTNMGSNSRGGISRSGSSGSYSYSVRSGRGNNPVNFVSFWDATRFANWLTTGETEAGVYVGGVTGPVNTEVTRDADAWAAGGVAIASEDEWYKAAYYSGSPTGAAGEGYWLYPTQSNSITTADANVRSGNAPIAVGSYARPSHYGTFDQGGNLWEWSDTIAGVVSRSLRGGAFSSTNPDDLSPSRSFGFVPTIEGGDIGFRVSSLVAIPEPGHAGMLTGALTLWIAVMLKGRPPAGGKAASFKL